MLWAIAVAPLGKPFSFYTLSSWVVFILFGVLTFLESPGIESNLPTPHIGLWERINIAVFLLWVIVFALALLRIGKQSDSI